MAKQVNVLSVEKHVYSKNVLNVEQWVVLVMVAVMVGVVFVKEKWNWYQANAEGL